MSRFVNRYGPWAVVAGASRGLGLAWATETARRGLNVVMVAEDEQELTAALNRVKIASPGVQCLPCVVDLQSAEAASRIATCCESLDVGLFIYNATAPDLGPFLKRPLTDHLAIVQVNIASAVSLTHHFAGRMRGRSKGGIVLMSSLTALLGTPFIATYGASKSFLLSFGEALGEELAPAGIDVLVVAPGPVATPGYLDSLKPGVTAPAPVLTPAFVVRTALSRLGRRRVVVPGIVNRLVAFLFGRVLPRSLSVRILGRQTRRLYG